MERGKSGGVCTCPVDGYDSECPMARGGLGHVKNCPARRGPCPCLPGSISEAHCYVEARDAER